MGRRVSRAIRRAVGGVSRVVDSVTGDILDLDGSKQKDALEQQRREQERIMAEAEAQKKAEEDYQNKISAERDKVNKGDILIEDQTGVGLGDVKVDFTQSVKPKSNEDDELKKLLKRL